MGAKLTYPKVAIPQGRTFVVTGGNGGIGYETSKYIASHGGRVIIACRSEQKAITAIEKMQGEHQEKNSDKTGDDGALPSDQQLDIEYMQLDLSSLTSTMEFIDAYKSRGYPLDVLICNAGIAYVQYGETNDGYEQMFQVNYLSHHLIILYLLPLLKRSAPNSRVVLVSSLAHRGGAFKLDNIQGKGSYSRISFYNHSKLYQVMSMYSLARRLQDSGIGMFSLHPGVVDTGIVANNMSDSKVLVPMFQGFMKLFHLYRDPYQGAATTLVAALDPIYDGKSALYFDSCKPTEPIALSKDEEKQEALWKYSTECLKDYITEQQITDIFSGIDHDETKTEITSSETEAVVTLHSNGTQSENQADQEHGKLNRMSDSATETAENDDDSRPDDQRNISPEMSVEQELQDPVTVEDIQTIEANVGQQIDDTCVADDK